MATVPEERSGREIRLLMLVIIVAVAGLLVLARFRFPSAEIVTVSPTPSPLDRLAVGAPFDELGSAVGAAANRVIPLVSVLELAGSPLPEPSPRKAPRPSVQAPLPEPPGASRWTLALRVGADRLLAYLPSGKRPMIGGRPAQVLGEDLQRGLVLISSTPDDPRAANVVDFTGAIAGLPGYRYAVAVEAGVAGPAARPIFLPRLDPIAMPPWDSPLWRIGGEPDIRPGALLFTMDGRLIGLTVPQQPGIAIVAAATIERLVRGLGPAPSGGQ
jgi:hypothetical protein